MKKEVKRLLLATPQFLNCDLQDLEDVTSVPIAQETFSNIKYTGMGYIPDDFIKFHSQWRNLDDE